MIRTTTKSIWAKDGRVIAPMTRIDVLRWPENGWRLAFLIDGASGERIVTISEQDVEASTQRVP